MKSMIAFAIVGLILGLGFLALRSSDDWSCLTIVMYAEIREVGEQVICGYGLETKNVLWP